MTPTIDTAGRPSASGPSTAGPSSPCLSTPRWTAELAWRFRHLFWLKLTGITALIWLFFIAYFYLLRHPARAPVTMALTAFDRLVPLQPAWIVPYLSLWIYVGFAPGLQRSLRALVVYGCWASGLCVCGLTAFYFWPTAVAPLAPGASDFPGFALLQGIDASGNACPSMHVAIAVFSAICLDDLLRTVRAPDALRIVNAVWFALIAYSTMAVKQHVAIDVAAGAALGSVFAWASLRWRPSGWSGSARESERISSAAAGQPGRLPSFPTTDTPTNPRPT